MSANLSNPVVEYVILVYSGGVVTTIIGFADLNTAMNALNESCVKYNADWGYLYKGDGSELASFHR